MEEIQQIAGGTAAASAFLSHNFIELESAERDRVTFRLTIHPESKNIYGVVHGGALYTLADTASGVAARTDGRNYVTQSGGMNFLKNQSEGVIRATAHVRHRGRRTCLVDTDVIGDNGVLLATGQYIFFCIDPKPRADGAEKG